jgi:predicted HTH domain antitoxin
MSRTITIEIPDQLVKLLGSEEEIERQAKQALVMDLVRRGKISRGKAAELLGISLWDLPELLSRYEIPWFTYSKEQTEADMEALCKWSVMMRR